MSVEQATASHTKRVMRLLVQALNRQGYRVLKVEDVGVLEGVDVVAITSEITPEDC